jgi:hypothetical protein
LTRENLILLFQLCFIFFHDFSYGFFIPTAIITTTISPSNTAQVNISQSLSTIINGGDKQAATNSILSQIQSLGGNSTFTAVLNSFSDLLAVLVANPNDTQKALISQKIANLSAESEKYTKAQFAQDFQTDPVVINDPAYSTFLNTYNVNHNRSLSLIADPTNAYDFYKNSSEVASSFIVLLLQTSKDVAAKKACKEEKTCR